MKMPRLAEWYAIGLLLLVLIWHLAPAQLPVLAYKLLLVSVAVVAGSILERRFLPAQASDTARAIVLASIVLGLTLGI